MVYPFVLTLVALHRLLLANISRRNETGRTASKTKHIYHLETVEIVSLLDGFLCAHTFEWDFEYTFLVYAVRICCLHAMKWWMNCRFDIENGFNRKDTEILVEFHYIWTMYTLKLEHEWPFYPRQQANGRRTKKIDLNPKLVGTAGKNIARVNCINYLWIRFIWLANAWRLLRAHSLYLY